MCRHDEGVSAYKTSIDKVFAAAICVAVSR